jgi:hypothetical protein
MKKKPKKDTSCPVNCGHDDSSWCDVKPIDLDAVAEAERFGALAIGPKRFRNRKLVQKCDGTNCRKDCCTGRRLTPDERWATDSIQFPRLLAEIRAIGIYPHQYELLGQSMDLTRDRIDELLERAETEWQKIKERI